MSTDLHSESHGLHLKKRAAIYTQNNRSDKGFDIKPITRKFKEIVNLL